jgi:hypothetical protein
MKLSAVLESILLSRIEGGKEVLMPLPQVFWQREYDS